MTEAVTTNTQNCELKRQFEAAGADRAPTTPRFKCAEQTNQDKDGREDVRDRDQATAGQEENQRNASAGSAASVIDVLGEPGHFFEVLGLQT